MNRVVTPTPREVSAVIESAAADWLVRRQAGLTAADAARFEEWLAGDSRHRAAFAEVEAAWSTLSYPRTAGQTVEAKRQLAGRAQRRRRRWLAASVAGASLAVALGVMFTPDRTVRFTSPQVSSVTPRPNLQTLPDGSRVELNAGAEILAEFSPAQRGVRLLRGEALFSVKKDSLRPFVVTAGVVAVRAVGTAFSVRHDVGQIGVLVTEGRVAVQRVEVVAGMAAPLSSEPILVDAGGRVQVPADPARSPVVAAAPLSPAAMATALAWRGHRVEFTRTPIAEAVALFNGQNRARIVIADPGIGQIAISGVFWADDPESFVRLLESGFEVQAHHAGEVISLRVR